MEDKQAILKRVTPLAVLKPMTSEAKNSISSYCLGHEFIGIWQFPFRIGRESRVETVNGKLVHAERNKIGSGKPNNDIYLMDRGHFLQISREHFSIEKTETGYSVADRGSACGTSINTQKIGGEDRGGTHTLEDGDTIKIGAEDSPYLFQFITLN